MLKEQIDLGNITCKFSLIIYRRDKDACFQEDEK